MYVFRYHNKVTPLLFLDTLTVDELALLLDDLMAQLPVLLKALHHHILLADDIVLEKRVRLYLCILNLQLVHLTEQPKDLPLLL